MTILDDKMANGGFHTIDEVLRALPDISPERVRLQKMRKRNVLIPDVSFISAGRVPKDARVSPVSPDLAVEVLSKSNSKKEMSDKREHYFGSGTKLVWEFDPAQKSVAVYRSPTAPPEIVPENGELDDESVLPGFRLKVSDVFAAVED